MTLKLFWQDPYRTEADATVVSVSGGDVTLDQTVVYAFSGGQESDHGTIAGHPLLAARKDGRDIIHTLAEAHGLQSGDRVRVTIDGDRRNRLMRLHFAAELILELIYQAFPDTPKIGAHIAADKARIDFTWIGNISALFPMLLERVEAIVAANLPIVSAFADEATEQRYWQIDGFARVPCGGTHPRRTGEVGRIALKRRNPGGGKERIEITLADSPS
jgi:Ser-tRNA(Ala) deacylase AlaX